LPPAGLGLLTYAADGDIYVAEGDGWNPVRIADGLPGGKSGCGSAGYWAEGPMWSPDSRFLAYRSPRSRVQCDRPEADTIPTVLISDPAGHVVAEFPGVGWRIPWSPDSTRVATWLDLYPSTQIGVYGLDGVRQAVISLPPGKEPPGDYDAVWSYDGSSLLVPLGDPAVTNEFGERRIDVWELPVDGTQPRRLPAEDPESHWLSSPSPDGGQVAYIVGDRPVEGTLFVADADGAHARALSTGVTDWWGNSPVWSPTGDRVAIVGGGSLGDVNGSQFLDNTRTELRLVNVANGSVTTIIPAGSGAGISVIAFSSDGDRVLIARSTDDGAGDSLWSVATDGSSEQELISGTRTGDWQHVPAAQPPTTAPDPETPVAQP
jgi:Tol biopolymer transport system component